MKKEKGIIATAFSRKADEQLVKSYLLSEDYKVISLQQTTNATIDLVVLDTVSAHALGQEKLQQLKLRKMELFI